MGNVMLTIALGAAMVLTLPDSLVMQNEYLWQLRETLRRALFPDMKGFFDGPRVRFLALCLGRCCCGRLASPCRVPHSLRAQALGCAEIVLWWTAQLPPANPFHEEAYLCSWCRSSESVAQPGGSQDAEALWSEARLEDLGLETEGRGGARRQALLQGLPPRATLRLRLCAVNRLGRSAWSKEEIELALPAEERLTEWQAAGGLGRSRAAGGEHLCLQCRSPQRGPGGQQCEVAYARVLCRPVLGPRGCPHGPFCALCRRRVSAQVLPLCVCRALIEAWHEAGPGTGPGVARPARPQA